MLLSVVTITCRWGSLDVLFDSLSRQTLWPQLIAHDDVEYWLVDEHADDDGRRIAAWDMAHALGLADHRFHHVKPMDYDPPRFIKIARANNTWLRHARGDYVFLLNDYIWCPDDTLTKFFIAAQHRDNRTLISATCHIAAVPPAEAMTNPTGPTTIFVEPFRGATWGFPNVPIYWHDPRTNGPEDSQSIDAWEAHVAFAPLAALRAVGWEEDFDYARAADNNQVAAGCLINNHVSGITVLHDLVCYALPHLWYIPYPDGANDVSVFNVRRLSTYIEEKIIHQTGEPLRFIASCPSIAFVFQTGNWGRIDPRDPLARPLGGRETAAISLARELAIRGWHVNVTTNTTTHYAPGMMWRDVTPANLRLLKDYDVVVSIDDPALFRTTRAKLNILHSQFATPPSVVDPSLDRHIDAYLLLSHEQRVSMRNHSPAIDADKTVVIGNGIDLSRYDADVPTIPGRFVWSSSPDRGLHHLLRWWPTLKEQFPHITLRVFYRLDALEPMRWQHETRAEWARIVDQGRHLDGVTYVGPVDQATLAREQQAAELWVYPCDPATPTETWCITATEMAAARVPMLLSPVDCLGEVYGRIAWFLPLPIDDATWIQGITELLSDATKRTTYVAAAHRWAEQHTWSNIGARWDAYLRRRLTIPDAEQAANLADAATYTDLSQELVTV